MKIKSLYVKPILNNIICEDCNVIMEQIENVLATYPPKYSYICPNCGRKETSYTLFHYVTYEIEPDISQSVTIPDPPKAPPLRVVEEKLFTKNNNTKD